MAPEARPGQEAGLAALARMRQRARAQRVPLSGTLCLTDRCNLHCVHCYRREPAAEWDTGKWHDLLAQLAEAGCLNLLLTGGEVLLRQDFGAIYRRARELGFLVSVFTNGTRVTPALLDLFTELPPQVVEVTLYGATAATYEAVTGVRGSYRRCRDGIAALAGRGVRVQVKTILMTINRHEFHQIESIAGEVGDRFRFDAAIFPRLDGDPAPLAFRVPATEAVQFEMSSTRRVGDWQRYLGKRQDLPPSPELSGCSAALTGFAVTARGMLQPCLMVENPSFDLNGGTFLQGWDEVLPRLRGIRADPDSRCTSCGKRDLCGYCPAFFALETGSPQAPSDYLCALGDERYHALQAAAAVGDN